MKKKYESDFIKNKIVKINKMKAGADDYEFNVPTVKNFFLEKCGYININPQEKKFKVLYKKMHTLGLILFGVNLEYINNYNYLPYIYYLYKDNVKFKKIKKLEFGFTFTNITFEELLAEKFDSRSYTNLLFESLSDPKNHNWLSSNPRNDEFNKLLIKLSEKITEQQMQQPYQQQMPLQMQQQIPLQMPIFSKIKELEDELQALNKFQKEKLGKLNLTNLNKNDIRELTIQTKQLKTKIEEELKKEFLSNQEKKYLNTKLQELSIKQQELKSFKNKKGIFNIDNITDIYICDDPTIEVLIKANGNIFFGYNQYLILKTSDGLFKLYYKYSYRNNDFYELKTTLDEKSKYGIKKDGELKEEKINFNLIPIYDILCLNLAVKNLPNRRELQEKLKERIDKAKENISKTGEAFFKLDDSNFEKEKRQLKVSQATPQQKKITNVNHTNFGKVKKRRVTGKTYIFFGAGQTTVNMERHILSNFGFVCFREDDKVFYYEKGKLNEKKLLYNFPYIYPLEDLISFILLRRMITADNNFADDIYREAQRTIKVLKTIKFTEKITIHENPNNWRTSHNSRLIPTKNYFNKRMAETPKSQQTSILPISQGIIDLDNRF